MPPASAGYRLILSDLARATGEGHQKLDQQIFRFEDTPLSIDQLVQVSQEKLFATGLEPNQPLMFIGHLGGKRRVLHDDKNMFQFFQDVGKAIPSIEVQLPDVKKRLSGQTSDAAAQEKRKQDYVQQLEAANRKLHEQWEVTTLRVDELARLRQQDREETTRVHDHGIRQVRTSLEDYVKQMNVRMDTINKQYGEGQKTVRESKDLMLTLRKEVAQLTDRAEGLTVDLKNNVEDLVGLLHKGDVRAQGLQDQIRNHQAHLHKHDADLHRHEEIKVNVGAFEIFQQEMADTVANLRERHKACEDDVAAKYEWTVNTTTQLNAKVDDHWEKIMAKMETLAMDISQEIDEKCAKTLDSANTHTDAIAKKHRDKIAKIKDDLAKLTTFVDESNANHSAALQEAQRTLRRELGEAATAIHEAVKNLNDKQAATKAELTMTIERLNTFKEQSNAQFSEMGLQAQALNVHSQEGLAAVTRLINSLKEDQLRFKEKMAQHVSMLQHSNTTNEETCHVLEQERKRFAIDNKMLTDRMNGLNDWTEEVDVKLLKLYRYVQPTRVEWRIQKVMKKKKELACPMLIKSPTFSIAGLKDLRFDFYPNGYYGLPNGTCCVRFYAPIGTAIKYECYFGTMLDGPHEWRSGEESLWNDHLFKEWDGEVAHNAVTIAIDILENLSEGEDGAVGGALKIDCE